MIDFGPTKLVMNVIIELRQTGVIFASTCIYLQYEFIHVDIN
jgi:hypothetical protein